MNTRWLLAMTAVLAFFPWGAGCEAPAGGGGADTTEGEDTGGGGEVAIGGEVSGPLLQCPSGEPITGPLPLLPRPRSVLHLADPIPLSDATASWHGETPQERRALEELAAGLGLAQTSAGEAGLRVEFLDDAAWDALLACPEAPPDGEEAYILIVDAAPGGARVRIASGADAGRRHALATLRQLLAPGPPVTVRAAAILDAPAFPMRGVIEGFYGPPWSREARLAFVAELARLKLNTFVYAPKGDATINTAWMLPFAGADLDHIAALAAEASAHGIRICFELHPSFGFHYSSPADLDLLVGKFRQVVERGVDCLVLAFDDVSPILVPPDPEVYPSWTAAQADFLPRLEVALRAEFPDVLLAFVPGEYYSAHPDAATSLPMIGAAAPPDWQIAWTGREIISAAITRADALELAGWLGRAPLLGDNYPVSDNAAGTGVVHLGPLEGRSPELVGALSGVAFNAMPLALASLPALATAADWAWSPAAYDPEASMAHAAAFYGGPAGAGALRALCDVNRSPILAGSHAPALAAALDALASAWEGGGDLEAPAMVLREGFFLPFQAVPAGLASPAVHPGVAAELDPWAEALAAAGDAGILALDLLRDARDGGADPAAVAALEAAAAALAARSARPTGPTMQDFLELALDWL